MNKSKLILASQMCVGVLIVASFGQQPASQLKAQTGASVIAGESQSLTPGQEFKFQLRFNPPPDGYGGGEIHFSFKSLASSPAGHRIQNWAEGSVPLQDGG